MTELHPPHTGMGSTFPPARGLLGRFVHLLSAEGLEAAASTIFFLYLAWVDATFYGAVMYAMAAGAVAAKVVKFGLYYPLVTSLAGASETDGAAALGRANAIKLALTVPTLAAVWGVAVYRGFSGQVAGILLVICLGFILEALAETFFADLRMRGMQKIEARIRMGSSAVSYAYGFLAALTGFPPVAVALFRLLSGGARLAWVARSSLARQWRSRLLRLPWEGAWEMFCAASVFALIEILGIVYNKTNVFFMERVVGMKGVALYSATWGIVDPFSTLASEQLLGWVVFPMLASLWGTNRTEALRLVRSAARWLLAAALPIMFLLHVESDILIGWLYPQEYIDAASLQRHLVWTVLLSFESNLFCYLMMVTGASRLLLVFAAVTAAVNITLNLTLVKPLGLAGGCWVIVLTKLVMTVQTLLYSHRRFRFIRRKDFVEPLVAGAVALCLFWALRPQIGLHFAAGLAMIGYACAIWVCVVCAPNDPGEGEPGS
jgi:O-antigen/teichoic acid export membrane protein